MVLTRRQLAAKRSLCKSLKRKRGIKKSKRHQLRFRGNHTAPPQVHHDIRRKPVIVYQSMKSEYIHRVRHAPKQEREKGRERLPICYSSLGNRNSLQHRPLGRLPPHIIEALNDHYIQLTRGLMVPEADLYNNDDQPVEHLFPSVLEQRDYERFIRGIGDHDVKEKAEKAEKTEKTEKTNKTNNETPAETTAPVPPEAQPYTANHLAHGEIIGSFVIFGSGQITRAVCSKTREVFTAHVLPRWKVPKVIDVIRRLQMPDDMLTHSPDEIRLSELCVSQRTEIIKCNDRFVIFTPIETNTIHSVAMEKLDRMTEKEAMEIYKKVVEIVKFCHSRKVLVRNFKTRNFYLKKDDKNEWIVRPCFIQDMCCEEDDTDAQFTRRSVCVPFMAPEMLSAEAKPLHSQTTDLWGLGVLLYILLTGKYPFHANSMPLLFRAIKLKQHRWPLNFVSCKSRDIANRLLRKTSCTRLTLDKLWQEMNDVFPDVRCRSNLLMKQQDLIVKMEMFEMYWEAYRDRLLPQNVIPMFEELEICRQDLPIATELAKRDLRLIEESIREDVKGTPNGYHESVITLRLEQINSVLARRELEEADKANRVPNPVTLTANDISMELLLPAAIYPISEHYHPSQNRVDWLVYCALEDAGELDFPAFTKGRHLKVFPTPEFFGRNVAPPI